MKKYLSNKFKEKHLNRKGQMKIQQMAFMLIVIFLFFALIGMVIISFKFSGMKEAAAVLEEQNAMLLVSKLANSPEFSCGGSFGTAKINCIDMDKVFVLKQNINTYEDFWNIDNIEIRKIYPILSGEVKCDLNNYPECNYLNLMSEEITGIGLSSFVSLCRIEEGNTKCELGKLIVSYNI